MRSNLTFRPWLVAETSDAGVIGYAYASEHSARAAYRWSVNISAYVDPARWASTSMSGSSWAAGTTWPGTDCAYPSRTALRPNPSGNGRCDLTRKVAGKRSRVGLHSVA